VTERISPTGGLIKHTHQVFTLHFGEKKNNTYKWIRRSWLNKKHKRFKILTTVNAMFTVFWHVETCTLTGIPTFRRDILPPSSVTSFLVSCSTVMLVSLLIYQTTQHHIWEESILSLSRLNLGNTLIVGSRLRICRVPRAYPKGLRWKHYVTSHLLQACMEGLREQGAKENRWIQDTGNDRQTDR
jgi:hypothetical protein